MLTFLKSLFVAALSGATTTVSELLSEKGGMTDMGRIRNAAIVGAVLGLAMYLKQSPLKTQDQIDGAEALHREMTQIRERDLQQ
jgi:hypothetical protein